jgi:hypothetical protein
MGTSYHVSTLPSQPFPHLSPQTIERHAHWHPASPLTWHVFACRRRKKHEKRAFLQSIKHRSGWRKRKMEERKQTNPHTTDNTDITNATKTPHDQCSQRAHALQTWITQYLPGLATDALSLEREQDDDDIFARSPYPKPDPAHALTFIDARSTGKTTLITHVKYLPTPYQYPVHAPLCRRFLRFFRLFLHGSTQGNPKPVWSSTARSDR